MNGINITIEIKAEELANAISQLAAAFTDRNIIATDKIVIDMAAKKKTAEQEAKLGEDQEAETKETTPQDVEPETKEEPEEKEEPITIEQVRAAFMSKNSKENSPKLRAILKKFGVTKVTDLPEEKFADALKELEAIE
jgi:hypothetical protein